VRPELVPATDPAGSRLPAPAARLFGHYDPEELDTRRAAPFLIGRLLEDGDGDDLCWLARTCPETELATWLACHGPRTLSARSLAFWSTVLGGAPASPGQERLDLWPL
jgi:hypothetical protein